MLEFGPGAVAELRGVYRKCLVDRGAVGGAEAKVREEVVRHRRRRRRSGSLSREEDAKRTTS
jgi:hypothetical protein